MNTSNNLDFEKDRVKIFIDRPEIILQFENLTNDKVGKVYVKTREGYILDLVVNPRTFVIIDDIVRSRPHWINNTIIIENVLVSAISDKKCTGQIHTEVLYEGDPEHAALQQSKHKKDSQDIKLAAARMAYREIMDVIEKWESMGDGMVFRCHWDECISVKGELFQRSELRQEEYE